MSPHGRRRVFSGGGSHGSHTQRPKKRRRTLETADFSGDIRLDLVMRYEQKNLVHDAVYCWTGNSDNSSADDVLSGTLLLGIGPGILARGVGDHWDRSDCHFKSSSPARVGMLRVWRLVCAHQSTHTRRSANDDERRSKPSRSYM